MPTLTIANLYGAVEENQLPWTIDGSNTFERVDATIILSVPNLTIISVNGVNTGNWDDNPSLCDTGGWQTYQSGGKTYIQMCPHLLTDGDRMPPTSYDISYADTGGPPINGNIQVLETFYFKAALVSANPGCSSTYSYQSVNVPTQF